MRDDTRKHLYRRARRHSFAVAFLKRVLPLGAFAVVGGFAAAAVLSGAFEERTASVSTVTKGEVVMEKPRLDGMDRNSRPYELQAEAARQETVRPTVVKLDTVGAKLPTDDGTFASIDATAGVYDTQKEVLVLSEGVRVRDMKGLDMDLANARVDMGAGTMVSEEPVAVRSRNAEIDAQSMTVLDNGKRILFNDRVRMVIPNRADVTEAQVDQPAKGVPPVPADQTPQIRGTN